MVMPSYRPPTAGPLDWMSRVDNILLEQRQQNEAIKSLLQQLVSKTGSGGSINLCDSFLPVGGTALEIRQALENGSFYPYQIKTIANMDTAVTDLKIELQGQSLLGWTDGSLAGIGVRLNSPQADIIYLNRFNPLKFTPFWTIYLTYPVQAGKQLQLFVGRTCDLVPEIPSGGAISSAFQRLVSDKDAHFTGAIAQNAIETENIAGLISNNIKITGIAIESDQNLAYRLLFWRKDTAASADLDIDEFIADQELDLPSYGFQVAGAGQYYMFVDGLDIEYQDADDTYELHVSLQNLSATGKNAGATGEVKIVIFYEEAG